MDNVTALYYCGTKTEGYVRFTPCDIHHVYITLAILTSLPILLILCSLCPVQSSKDKYVELSSIEPVEVQVLVQSQPPKYEYIEVVGDKQV
jgi:hypothetical protein